MPNPFADLIARLDQLPEHLGELVDGIRLAIRVAAIDPEMSLTRARKVLERIVHDVFEQSVGQPPGTRPLQELIQRLVKDKHLPTRVAAYVNTVRELGNAGTHASGEPLTGEDVTQSISQLLIILDWYDSWATLRETRIGGSPEPLIRQTQNRSTSSQQRSLLLDREWRESDQAGGTRPIPSRFGRYQILHRLGESGKGSVFLAEDPPFDRQIALKILDFGPEGGAEARRRFLDEVRLFSLIRHASLCPILDFGVFERLTYAAMEYVEGKSLAWTIRDEGLPPRQVASMVGKVALAMVEAHRRNVVHRRLKSTNIILKSTGQKRDPVIVDFGQAHRDPPEGLRMTDHGPIAGTIGYLAPEQIQGGPGKIGPAADIYALGVILYELLTGRLPHRGSGQAVADQVLSVTPTPPSFYRKDLEPTLEAICLKAMTRQVGDRFSSMGEFTDALVGFLRSPSAS